MSEERLKELESRFSDPKFNRIPKHKRSAAKYDERFDARKQNFKNELKFRDRRDRKINKLRILEEDEPKHNIRGEVENSESSSESESDSESEPEIQEDDEKDLFDQAHDDVKRSEDISRRLAVQNMDWDRVNAADIFVLMKSSCPSTGRVEKVTVYPSQFGKERIEIENKIGPRISQSTDGMDETEKLRLYQLERLKYYYAVVETSDPETADTIYTDIDNQAYGESGIAIDLRFIPDEISFEEDTPRATKIDKRPDVCTETPRNYELPDFVTSALTRSKVSLTWDETDKKRTSLLRKGDFADDQVAHLIASGSESENEEENEEAARKWRAKFAGILDDNPEKSDTNGHSLKNKKNENEKEFTIEADLEDDQGSDCLLSDEENNLSDNEGENVKSEDEKDAAELDLVMFDPEDAISGSKHFDLREEKAENKKKGKRAKRKEKKEMPEGMDLSDNRFSSRLLDEDAFGIDRTHPNYKPSKAMNELQRLKNKKRSEAESSALPPPEEKRVKIETKKGKKKLDDNDDLVRRLKLRANK